MPDNEPDMTDEEWTELMLEFDDKTTNLPTQMPEEDKMPTYGHQQEERSDLDKEVDKILNTSLDDPYEPRENPTAPLYPVAQQPERKHNPLNEGNDASDPLEDGDAPAP